MNSNPWDEDKQASGEAGGEAMNLQMKQQDSTVQYRGQLRDAQC
ncbi:hypothetical protein WN093_00505 [Gammaproteobacteria bacterium AS21]